PNVHGSSTANPSPRPASSSNKGNEREDKDKQSSTTDRVKIIETFAKEAIRHYKRNITVEEYKDVMRAVVRECYKKKILDGDKVKEKVKEYVRVVKSGEQLEVGHHSSKRAETSGEKSAVPVKRQKVDA
ncbi:hypothetical protein ANCCAN_13202, partial [Ancylostoma caninum]